MSLVPQRFNKLNISDEHDFDFVDDESDENDEDNEEELLIF